MSHFFISYAHNDSERVQQLADLIKKRQFPIWMDTRLIPGDHWPKEILKAIQDSVGFIIMMSPASASSSWVEREFLLADKIHCPILPIMLADLNEGDFWYLAGFQHEDVRRNKHPNDAFFAKLAKLLHQEPPQARLTEKEYATAAVEAQDTVNQRSKQQEEMTQYLQEYAKVGLLPVTYAEVASKFSINLASDVQRYHFSHMLGRISQSEHEQGRPLLSAGVVKADEMHPGRGFYGLARSLKPQYAKMEDEDIYVLELKAVLAYWGSLS